MKQTQKFTVTMKYTVGDDEFFVTSDEVEFDLDREDVEYSREFLEKIDDAAIQTMKRLGEAMAKRVKDKGGE